MPKVPKPSWLKPCLQESKSHIPSASTAPGKPKSRTWLKPALVQDRPKPSWLKPAL
jgi:hypothetical protein